MSNEYQPVPLPHGENESPRDTDPLHEALQMHISGCDQCRKAVESSKVGFGQRSRMCQEYFNVVEYFSRGGQ